LNDELNKRPETWEGDLLALWEIIEQARVPAGLLMVKIREMQAGTFVGKPAPDKEVTALCNKYKLDTTATQRLAEVLQKRNDKKSDMEKLEKHLKVSNKPSALIMMMLGKLRKGEDIGEPDHKAAPGSVAWESDVKRERADRRDNERDRDRDRDRGDRGRDGRDRDRDRGRDADRKRRSREKSRDRSRDRGRDKRERRRDSRDRGHERSRSRKRSRSRSRSNKKRKEKSRSRRRSRSHSPDKKDEPPSAAPDHSAATAVAPAESIKWRSSWSAEHNRCYYYRPNTQEVVWVLPPGAVLEQTDSEPVAT